MRNWFNQGNTRGVERRGRKETVAALDIGCGKIACFIAEIAELSGEASRPMLTPLGFGHHSANGVRHGRIVDMAAAEAAIRAAVDKAERMADRRIHDVYVGVSGHSLRNRDIDVDIEIGGYAIVADDIAEALRSALEMCDASGSDELIHVFPSRYAVDDCADVRDPRGLCGDQMTMRVHALMAGAGPLRNLTTCIERCHLGVRELVAAPYASALGVLVEDEMELGAVGVDMGAGESSFALFDGGAVIHCGAAPVGGRHITADIANGLSTPLDVAERLKILHGSSLPCAFEERDYVEAPMLGERAAPQRIPRGDLNRIIRARLDETFELIRDRLRSIGLEKAGGRRVVLTGGASQLPGVREAAQAALGKQARLGKPIHLDGLAPAVGGPAFSTAAGLLQYAAFGPAETVYGAETANGLRRQRGHAGRGPVRWLRAHL